MRSNVKEKFKCAWARMSASQPVTLQPWLTGLTAVVVFLFVVFVFLILSRLFGKDRDQEEEEESKDMFAYKNEVVELREDKVSQTSL
ncbi:small integral membrane protein 24 isoform X4 [Vanacampus margaritifer]